MHYVCWGPEKTHSDDEFHKYGQNRIAEGKVPLCAAMCSTKALLVGDKKLLIKYITTELSLEVIIRDF